MKKILNGFGSFVCAAVSVGLMRLVAEEGHGFLAAMYMCGSIIALAPAIWFCVCLIIKEEF